MVNAEYGQICYEEKVVEKLNRLCFVSWPERWAMWIGRILHILGEILCIVQRVGDHT